LKFKLEMDTQLLLASLLILLLLEFPSVDIFPSAAGVPLVSVPAVDVVLADSGVFADSSIPAINGVQDGIAIFFLSHRMVRNRITSYFRSAKSREFRWKHQNFDLFRVPRNNFFSENGNPHWHT
jgi:hypothetical protein